MISIINFDITNACNFFCRGCYKKAGQDKGFIGPELVDKVMGEAKALGATSTGFSGGEPGLVPDRLLECLDIGKKHFQAQGVLTTGFNIDAWFEEALKKNLTFVQISLDGGKEYHNWYRGRLDAYDIAMHAIDVCEGKVMLRVNMVATKENIDEVDSLLDLANSRKIELRISPIVPLGNAENKELVMEPVDIILMLGKINKYVFTHPDTDITFQHDKKTRHKIDVQFGLIPFEPTVPFNCPSGGAAVKEKNLGLYPVVNEIGEVRMCNYLSMSAGNVKERSFTDIYLNPENMEEFFDAKPLNKTCANCGFRGVCIQGCRAFAYMMDGVFDYPDAPPERCFKRKRGVI